MHKLGWLISALMVSAPAISAAQTQPAAAPAGTTTRTDDRSKVICRTIDKTGSRLQRTRECHTAAEWAEIRAFDRRSLETLQAGRTREN